MTKITSVVLASTVAWLTGCAAIPKAAVLAPIGPAPAEQATGMKDGRLQIYTARVPAVTDVNAEEFFWNNDFGRNDFLYRPAHTDYTIYEQDGTVFAHVRNARDINDSTPTVVTLPPGTYQVKAQAEDYNKVTSTVTVPVVIEPGHTTVAHLQGTWKPAAHYDKTDVVWLPNGHIAGWRATNATLAKHPQPEAHP